MIIGNFGIFFILKTRIHNSSFQTKLFSCIASHCITTMILLPVLQTRVVSSSYLELVSHFLLKLLAISITLYLILLMLLTWATKVQVWLVTDNDDWCSTNWCKRKQDNKLFCDLHLIVFHCDPRHCDPGIREWFTPLDLVFFKTTIFFSGYILVRKKREWVMLHTVVHRQGATQMQLKLFNLM